LFFYIKYFQNKKLNFHHFFSCLVSFVQKNKETTDDFQISNFSNNPKDETITIGESGTPDDCWAFTEESPTVN
jgi:hypothetical protein